MDADFNDDDFNFGSPPQPARLAPPTLSLAGAAYPAEIPMLTVPLAHGRAASSFWTQPSTIQLPGTIFPKLLRQILLAFLRCSLRPYLFHRYDIGQNSSLYAAAEPIFLWFAYIPETIT